MAIRPEDSRERGARQLRDAGYKRARGGDIHADHPDEKQDKALIKRALHGAEKALKRGGKVHGEKSKARPDRRARGGMVSIDQPDDANGNDVKNSGRARGGKVGKGKVTINIHSGEGQQGDPAREQMAHQAGIQKGLAIGKQMAAGPAPGGAPGAPPGMAPPGGPPMPPRPPMAPPPGAGPAGPPMGGPPRPMMARGGGMRKC